MRKAAMIIIFLLLLFSRTDAFIEDVCPIGWQSIGETCIRTFLSPNNAVAAMESCSREGGSLLECSNEETLEDVEDLLQSLFLSGVLESTWLIASVGVDPRALRRDAHGKYVLTPVSSSGIFPFLCELSQAGKRNLLFQQQLMPKGAPRLKSWAGPSLFFHPQKGADFLPLPCSVEAQPAASVTWYQNDVMVVSPSSSNVSFLLSGGTLLVPADPAFAYSSFHCVASNRLGKVRGPSTLLKPAFLDAFGPSRQDVVPLEAGGARLECQAPNHQPKSQSYSWLIDSTEKVVRTSARVFVSLDGSLLFSYVTPDDDANYACSLSLSSTQSGHYGPFFRLRVTGSQPQSPPRMADPPQAHPETPTVGDNVYLECFAYANPVATYKWSRTDGRALSARCSVSNFGRILRIEGAREDDVGRYRCVAGNSIGHDVAEVTLTLRAMPTVLLPLSDILVSSDSEFLLDCPLSTADRHSTVEWFKDAQPIVPLLMPSHQRKRFHVNDNQLRVTGAKRSDAGVYQCMISNEVGVATSSAHISVHDSAPAFPAQAMPLKVFATKGTNISVPCVYQASPRGSVRWTDAGGTGIRPKGRVRDENGTLVIHNVLEDDQGLFFCTANNKIGTAHWQIDLVVNDPVATRQASVPLCQIEMTCEPNCPTEIKQPLEDSTRNGEKNHSHHAPHKGNHSKHHKHKKHFQPEPRRGRFPCSSMAGLLDSPRPLAPAPLGLTAKEALQGIRLSWRMPPQHREERDHTDSPVKGFLVELRTRSDRRWRAVPRDVVANTEAESLLLDKLSPNTDYQFRVRSVGSSHLGDASSPSSWVRTRPSIPRHAVDGLRWRALDPSTLLVEWEALEKDSNSGSNLRYSVAWSEGETEDSPSTFHAHNIESKSPQAIVRLNSSTGCRVVSLAVRAANDVGAALETAETVAIVSSSGKLRGVSIADAFALNGTHANVSWTWQGESECHSAHAVLISCHPPDDVAVSVSVAADMTSWLIGGLRPETEYECILKAFDTRGNSGEESIPVAVLTLTHPPVEAPVINRLSLRPLADETGYTTILEWSAIELRGNNKTDEETGYKIFIYISATASDAVVLSMPLHRLSDGNRPSARLDGLRLMYMYTIQVAGYNSGGLGPLSSSRVVRLGTADSLEASDAHDRTTATWTALILTVVYLLNT